MIERAYGTAQVPDGDDFAEEITHGWFNVVYRIRLRDGQQVVLKIAPPEYVAVLTRERNMMRNELAAMALVRDRTRVPVPRVDHADLSRELIDADYFFMEYVDADNFGLAAADGRLTAEVITAGGRQLGALNRELNSIVGPHFGPLEGPGSATWREAFTTMIEDTLIDGTHVQVDIGWDYDERRRSSWHSGRAGPLESGSACRSVKRSRSWPPPAFYGGSANPGPEGREPPRSQSGHLDHEHLAEPLPEAGTHAHAGRVEEPLHLQTVDQRHEIRSGTRDARSRSTAARSAAPRRGPVRRRGG
ncbi:phosphotransferase family protein [Nonomuraea purpurea]|uniref:Phosphotransferase family protein n=1 Tax=Nonomuraea purpurea TaxID=1849276 RepID=A0ABV8GRJ7_9ACTN